MWKELGEETEDLLVGDAREIAAQAAQYEKARAAFPPIPVVVVVVPAGADLPSEEQILEIVNADGHAYPKIDLYWVVPWKCVLPVRCFNPEDGVFRREDELFLRNLMPEFVLIPKSHTGIRPDWCTETSRMLIW